MKLTPRRAYSWQNDPLVPPFDAQGPVTVMDATCGLCARGAQWIARHDRAQEFRIIPQQSERGAALLRHYGLDPDDPVSWLYIVEGEAFTSIDGMIRAGQRLGGITRALGVLRVLPRSVQDWIYLRIARNRHRILGRTDMCSMPDPDVQARLLL